MALPSITFGGASIKLPGTYYQDNISALGVSVSTATPPLVLIGNCYGLEQNTPTTFTTRQDATAAVRGGPLAEFLPFVFNPSPTLNGASTVVIINAALNTQSSVVLNDNTGKPAIALTSSDYGTPENLKQVEVSAGSVGGSLITVYDGYSGATYAQDNLGVPFSITYVGSEASVNLTITPTALTLTSTDAAETVSVPLGSSTYPTVTDVINYLNGTGYYTAALNGISGGLPSTQLDAVSGVTLTNATAYPVTAVLNDPVYWFTNTVSALIGSATVVGASVPSGLAVIPLTHFSGATNTSPTVSDYADAFNVALGVPGFVVFADSGDASVQAMGMQHAVTASDVKYGRPRRFVTGSGLGFSKAAAIAEATSLNAYQVTYVHPGIYRTDSATGINTLYSGLYAAAAVAGSMCGNSANVALTNKALTGNGIEAQYLAADQGSLLDAGVMLVTMPDQTSVPTILLDVTTWRTDTNVANLYNQQVACRQYLEYVIKQVLAPYIGSIESTTTLAQQKNVVKTALNSQKYSGSNTLGVLNSWDSSSLVLTYDGTTSSVRVTVKVVFVGEVVYQLVTTYVEPLSLSV